LISSEIVTSFVTFNKNIIAIMIDDFTWKISNEIDSGHKKGKK